MFPYCKRWKAGRGLGTRLLLSIYTWKYALLMYVSSSPHLILISSCTISSMDIHGTIVSIGTVFIWYTISVYLLKGSNCGIILSVEHIWAVLTTLLDGMVCIISFEVISEFHCVTSLSVQLKWMCMCVDDSSEELSAFIAPLSLSMVSGRNLSHRSSWLQFYGNFHISRNPGDLSTMYTRLPIFFAHAQEPGSKAMIGLE